MKRVLVVVALVSMVGFTSCAKKRHTCPTYMKNVHEQKDVKVKNTLDPKDNSTKAKNARG